MSSRPWSQSGNPLAITGRYVPPLLTAVVLFAFVTAAAFLAHEFGRPVTAALVYVLGVTLIGAATGLWSGLLAALAASIVYNFFLSEPLFTFSVTSAEEYVPLIAFNLSAVISGLLAGRLNDRARAAERGAKQLQALFDVSGRLQAAARLRDIPLAIADFAPLGVVQDREIYIFTGPTIEPLTAQGRRLDLVERLRDSGFVSAADGDDVAYLLSTPNGPIGALLLHWPDNASAGERRFDLEAFVNLLSIALERCLLLERLAEAELIERSEVFKTALLSSVSHDMRTPLAAISASASSLSTYGGELPEATRADLLTMIQEQCDRLNRYTTNLLNLSRLQAGVDQRQLGEVEAIDVLGTAISQVRTLGSQHRIDKQFDIEAALVRADPVMLEQVFYNVVDNAVRYSPDGSRILVEARAERGHATITVTDEGSGIAPADLPYIFDRFFRAGKGVGTDGSGLGLSIARGFVEAFRGTITADSPVSDGGGTRVTITLPIDQDPNQVKA